MSTPEPKPRTLLEDVFAALVSSGNVWDLEVLPEGTIQLYAHGRRHLVEVTPRPVAGYDPATGIITCPHCGASSDSTRFEHHEDEVARRDVVGAEALTLTVDTLVSRFDDDGADPRLACTRCWASCDIPAEVQIEWSPT